ncbi:hypothetical protein ABTN40_19865, partial [Acinetobacter baumannii]
HAHRFRPTVGERRDGTEIARAGRGLHRNARDGVGLGGHPHRQLPPVSFHLLERVPQIGVPACPVRRTSPSPRPARGADQPKSAPRHADA